MTEKYPHTNQIKELLKGKSDMVRKYGLNYLIPNWLRFANEHADTEKEIYEWLNDLDARTIIDEILLALPDAERFKIGQDLKLIDEVVLSKTFEVNECVWGSEVEKKNNYNRQKHWYYYRLNDHIFETEAGRFTKRH